MEQTCNKDEQTLLSIVLACWKLCDQQTILSQFCTRNASAFIGNKIELNIVTDLSSILTTTKLNPRDYNLSSINIIEYPTDQQIFSIPKTINYGLKRSNGNIFLKTDPDIIFSKDAIQMVVDNVVPGLGLIEICADSILDNKFPEWNNCQKRMEGYGACFALHRNDWFKLCGYDERISGWGADDTEMAMRAGKELKLIVSRKFPVWHIAHNNRKGVVKHFPFKSNENLKLIKQNELNWHCDYWGEAK